MQQFLSLAQQKLYKFNLYQSYCGDGLYLDGYIPNFKDHHNLIFLVLSQPKTLISSNDYYSNMAICSILTKFGVHELRVQNRGFERQCYEISPVLT